MVITNILNTGDFKGEEAYIYGKTITIGLFKEKKTFAIDNFETIEFKRKDPGAFPIWAGMAFGGIIGGAIGSALSKNENYTRVKIRYGKKYASTLWLDEKSYDRLRHDNKNAKSAATIRITINK